MKLCLIFFGDFHVIGTELIGNTMSSFKNKKSVHRMLFVHSNLGMKYGKKKSFGFIQLLIHYIDEVRAKLLQHQHSHGTIFGK